jgi:tetratricopeptide (TPR) repeat protein
MMTPAGQFRPPMNTPAGSGLPPAPTTLTGLDPKTLAELLKRRYEEAKTPGRPMSTQALSADAAFARGDFPEAARLYGAALTASVTSPAELKAAKERDEAAAIEKAKAAEQAQDFGAAAIAWARAFEAVPNAESAHRATLAFRKMGNDPRRSVKYGEESVKLDPNKAAYRMALALAYSDAGLGVRARGEIERALALEPQNARIKEVATKIRGG